MAFFPYKGDVSVEWYPKTASTAFSVNAMVYSASGQLIPADSTSGDHMGVILIPVASTDSDYASASFVPVAVPHSDTEFLATDIVGTLTAAMVNTFRDLSTSLAVDAAAQAKNVVLITQFIAAATGVIKVNAQAYNLRVATT